MDALARLLDAPRGRDAYLLRASMSPPWSILLADESPLGLIAVARGSAWVQGAEGDSIELRAGDVAIARGPAEATVSHAPSVPPGIVILPGMRCESPDGDDLDARLSLGLRQWGNDPVGSTVMLMGCYQVRGEVTQRLLSALPNVIVVRAAELDSPLVATLADEIVRDAPGQSAVLDRLFDVLLVATIRGWVTSEGASAGLYGAQGDPIVGQALRLLHDNPAHSWTIAELAARVNVSRASLAQRFAKLVGEPPMTYLTGWRLALAADRLLEPGATVEAVAGEVGYSSAFALSTAFKRERGMSPKEHRARSLAVV